MSDVDLLVVQQHAVDGLDSTVGGLGSLVVDKSIALGATMLVGGDFARKDIAESREGIVKSLQPSRLCLVIMTGPVYVSR